MRKIYLLLLTVCFAAIANSQVTVTNPGNTTPGLAASYTSLANAITDLNLQTAISGPVTITLDPANPQTAPAGGYVINAALAGASLTNTVTIAGSGNTITASAAHTVSALNDAIFKIIGSDFITISGFTMTENVLNVIAIAATNTMTEWGVAVLYATATNGAQNITIQNNTIDLDRTYPNTFGIYSNSTHTAAAVTTSASATGAAGGNDNLKVYGNIITDVNMGIVHVGPTAAADNNISADIGGVALATGNTITNFGTTTTGLSGYANVSGTINGILVRNTRNYNISYNTIASSNGGILVGTANGIQIPASSTLPTGTLTQTINNNNISIRPGASVTINGINIPSGSVNATTTNNINNNDFNTFGHTVAATAAIAFIIQGGNPLTQTLNNNTFTSISVNTTGTITFFTFSQSLIATGSLSISSNSIVTGFTRTSVGSTTVWASNASSAIGSTHAINNNNFSNITLTGASAFTGISNTDGPSGGGPVKNVNGNTFSNIINGAGTITPISVNFSSTGTNVNNNTITNITTGNSITCLTLGTSNVGTTTASGNLIDPITSGGAVVIGISTGSIGAVISRNKIYDLSGTVAGSVVSGIAIVNTTAASNVTVVNNLVGNLTAPAATGSNAVIGINITGSATSSAYNVYYNTVYLNNTTSGAGFGSSGISALASTTAGTSTLTLRNNIIFNTSVQNGAGLTVAYRRSSGTANTLANYGAASNNNMFYAGTPSATNLIYSDGTSTAQTIAAYKSGVFTAGTIAPRDAGSITEDPEFQSVVGASADFLKYKVISPKQVESGAVNLAGITVDFAGTIRQGNGGYAGTGTAPDIGAWELEGIPLDLTAPVISYTPILSTLCLTAPTLVATITDASGVNVAPGTKPRLWYRKGSNLDALPATNDNTTDGWKYVEASNAASPFSFTFDYTLLFGGAPVAGDVIHYFVVAQDLATIPNLGMNAGTFATPPPTVALNAGAFPVTGNNSFSVLAAIGTSVTVGAAGTYPSLTGAGTGLFADINSKGLSGNTTVTILDPAIAETGAVALNQIAYGCAGPYTLTIRPDVGISPVLLGAFAGPLIDLNGADNVIFDGSNSGGSTKDMTILNTSTTGQTIRFINDATNNIVRNSIIQGVNTSTTSGTIVFSTSTGTLGNSTNTINNCDVMDGATVPANAIYSSGSAGGPNGTNTVSGCNVFNFTNAGVLVTATGAGNGWTVNPSSFYQTAPRTTAMTAIGILGGSGHSIINNSIGGTAPLAGGTNMITSSTFRGIDLSVGTASATSVQGNTVKNIRSTVTGFTASYGIFLQAGTANIGNVTGNTIGSANVAERVEINGDSYGIRVVSSSTVNLSNNTVNNFGTNAAPSTGEYYFGISVEGTGGTHSVINNTIMNVTNASVPDASFETRTFGLIIGATGVQTVRGNTIHDVGSVSVTAPPSTFRNRVWGLILSNTAAGTVADRNAVYNIYASSAGAATLTDVITLLQTEGTTSAIVSNNMVANGTVNPNSDRPTFGIVDIGTAGAVTFYYNSVNITGTATAANSTYGYIKASTTATTTLRNNIFSNTRTGGTGFHPAIANANGTATGWAPGASDYNDLYSADPTTVGQWLGTGAGNNRTFAAWQAAQPAGSGGDANSVNVLPVFVGTTDLHLSNAAGVNCQVDGAAIPVSVVVDFDNAARDAAAPDMGADEFTSVPSTTLAGTPGGGQVCSNKTVGASGTTYKDASCNAIARVEPNGGSPVSGTVNSCVTIDLTVQTYNSQAYLQRHFDITPATNQATATARVTLYALQSEFDTYNLSNGADPDLMTGPGDVAGKFNLRVTKYSGNGTAPGNYVPGVVTVIDPVDADIVWNGTYWEISFDVTGFSGLYVHSGLGGALPTGLLAFSGYKEGSHNTLKWTTTNEQNNAGFDVQRSLDGVNYTSVGFVNTQALGGTSSAALNYTFLDNNPVGAKQYYRLRQVDINGVSRLSNIILIKGEKPVILTIAGLFPNPAKSQVNVLLDAPVKDKVTLVVMDAAGRSVIQQPVSVEAGSNTIPVDITRLTSGTYMVKLVCSSNCETATARFVKQ